MTNFINKHFRKNQCVKVIYFGEGKRHSINYLIPKGNTVSLGDKSFILNNKEFSIDSKNFITYVFSYNRLEPIDPNAFEKISKDGKEIFDPAVFDSALNSRIASEILDASKNKTDINIFLMIAMFIMIVGFAFLWYTFNEQFNALNEALKPLLEVLQ